MSVVVEQTDTGYRVVIAGNPKHVHVVDAKPIAIASCADSVSLKQLRVLIAELKKLGYESMVFDGAIENIYARIMVDL